MNRNIAAWTSPDAVYPQFVSINWTTDNYDKKVEITVRDRMDSNGKCGGVVSMQMSKQEFALLLLEAMKNVAQ